MWRSKLVGVLLGGPSAERDVSLRSGAACARALRGKGYDVLEIDTGPDLADVLRREKVDVVFNILHGPWGEDGCVQGLLEMMRIPYTGAGVLASAAAMDKVVSKALFREAGLPVAPHIIATRDAVTEVGDLPFPLPVVVKPAAQGSSVGVSVVVREEAFRPAVDLALADDARALIEPYIKGRELHVGVFNGHALGLVEVCPKPVAGEDITFYDYKHKYTSGMTDYISRPVGIAEEHLQGALDLARRACLALGVDGAPRVDLILGEDGRFIVMEINTLPGMTELSLMPMIAREWAGISFEDFVEKILNTARLKVGA